TSSAPPHAPPWSSRARPTGPRPSSGVVDWSCRSHQAAPPPGAPPAEHCRGKIVMELINANPVIHEKRERRTRQAPEDIDENATEAIDQLEIFDHIRDIKDPEHPYSLEDLNVVNEDSVEINDELSHVRVTFTPTVEHCSMATIIGLCLRVKLMRSLPPRYKVDIRLTPGSHATEAAVNKQLSDKERVAAALENSNLLDIVEECLSPTLG
ncbi:protein AE7-like, partial [Hordeum vulgare subsp. vulgare]